MCLLPQWHLLLGGGRGHVIVIGGRSLSRAWATEESHVGGSGVCKSTATRAGLSSTPVASPHSIKPGPAGAALLLRLAKPRVLP